jgi:hypothetical protein
VTAARRRPRRRVSPGQARTRVERHRFVADAAIPPDHRQRGTCATCHCLGAAGDARHLNDDQPDPVAARSHDARVFEARMLGEPLDD